MKKRISLLILSLVLILSFTLTATELKEAEVLDVTDGEVVSTFMCKFVSSLMTGT